MPKKYILLNKCLECGEITELREYKKDIRFYCVKCKRCIGVLGSVTWRRKNNITKEIKGKNKINYVKTLKELKTMDYDKYLKGSWWRQRRKKYWDKYKKICFCCGLEADIIHHNNYSRRGEEQDKDLVPVCSKCHSYIHDLTIQEKDITLENAHIVVRDLNKLNK